MSLSSPDDPDASPDFKSSLGAPSTATTARDRIQIPQWLMASQERTAYSLVLILKKALHDLSLDFKPGLPRSVLTKARDLKQSLRTWRAFVDEAPVRGESQHRDLIKEMHGCIEILQNADSALQRLDHAKACLHDDDPASLETCRELKRSVYGVLQTLIFNPVTETTEAKSPVADQAKELISTLS
jgi:hypothetical protein